MNNFSAQKDSLNDLFILSVVSINKYAVINADFLKRSKLFHVLIMNAVTMDMFAFYDL